MARAQRRISPPRLNGTSSAIAIEEPVTPVTRNRRRRPLAWSVQSETAPASGAIRSATKAPIAWMRAVMPSFAACPGPRIAAILSGTTSGTTVSQLAKSANHKSDTAI
jgi:hypothetical protein